MSIYLYIIHSEYVKLLKQLNVFFVRKNNAHVHKNKTQYYNTTKRK